MRIFSIKLTMPPGYSATVSQETVSTHKGPGTTLPNFTIDQKLLIGKWELANIALIRRTAKINTSLICLFHIHIGIQAFAHITCIGKESTLIIFRYSSQDFFDKRLMFLDI